MSIQSEPWEVHLNGLLTELDEQFRPHRYFPNKTKAGYALCCTASLAKCIDFNVLLSTKTSTRSCGFLSTSMRSMCEELIILAFLGTVPRQDADQVVELTMAYEVSEKLKTQQAF
jgi:hypothetical protein